jgi:hypothetical protein
MNNHPRQQGLQSNRPPGQAVQFFGELSSNWAAPSERSEKGRYAMRSVVIRNLFKVTAKGRKYGATTQKSGSSQLFE